MANAIGTKSKMALVKGAAWGTAVDLTTNHRVPFVSSSLFNEVEQITDETLTDASTRRPPINGNERNEGDLQIQSDYRQHLLMAAMFMGAAGAPTLLETGAYKHAFKFQTGIDGLFATMGIDKGGVSTAEGTKKCEAWASVKPTRRTIQSSAGDKCMETFDLIAAGYFETETPSAWTYAISPENGGGRTLVHARAALHVNAQAGADFHATTDRFYPNRVEIVMDRNLSRDFSNGVDVNEPLASGFNEINLRLGFYTATRPMLDLFRDAHRAGTILKARLVYTHSVLVGATQYFTRKFWFPKLKVVRAPLQVAGPGPLPYTVEFTAHLATAAPTGFPTGYVEECCEEQINEISSDPLA